MAPRGPAGVAERVRERPQEFSTAGIRESRTSSGSRRWKQENVAGGLRGRVAEPGGSCPLEDVGSVEGTAAFDQNGVQAAVQVFAKPALAQLTGLLDPKRGFGEVRPSLLRRTGGRGLDHPAPHVEVEKRPPCVSQIRDERRSAALQLRQRVTAGFIGAGGLRRPPVDERLGRI